MLRLDDLGSLALLSPRGDSLAIQLGNSAVRVLSVPSFTEIDTAEKRTGGQPQ
jgi:hypothetical protein